MTVFKHPNGNVWRYDFWHKRRRYTGTTDQLTRDDAKLVEAQIKTRLRQQAWGIAPVDREHTPTFTAWAEVFLTHQEKRLTRPDLMARTLRMLLGFWGARPAKPIDGIAPYHNLRLADPIIDADWLVKFESWMDTRDLSGSTKNTYRSALSGLYKLALKPTWRKKTHIALNPCIGLDRDAQRSRKVTLTMDALRAWIVASPPHVRLALAIGALAPKLRLATILALRWNHEVSRDLQFISSTHHKTMRHTGEAQVVPIDPQLRAILKPLQRKTGPVVAYRGEAVKSIKTALKRAAVEAGLDYGRAGVTFHSLRHTMATMLAELGVEAEMRRLVMGHTDIRTTQGYTHVRPVFERAPLALLSAEVTLLESVQGPVQGAPIRTRKKASKSRGSE